MIEHNYKTTYVEGDEIPEDFVVIDDIEKNIRREYQRLQDTRHSLRVTIRDLSQYSETEQETLRRISTLTDSIEKLKRI
jgi:hypothetical protein